MSSDNSLGKCTTLGKGTKITLGLLLAAIAVTFAFCKFVGVSPAAKANPTHNPDPYEERIRALELESVRGEEFRRYVRQELGEIKQAIQKLGD